MDQKMIDIKKIFNNPNILKISIMYYGNHARMRNYNENILTEYLSVYLMSPVEGLEILL